MIAFLFFVTGCDTSQVADDLAQREANEIVAVLRQHRIDSSTHKERGSRGRYSVSVESGKFGEAVSVLHELGLPAEKKASFSELVSPSGILPSSREVEALRLDRALAAEIEDLFKGHPAVVGVAVVVRYHGVENGKSPSVSMVIQYRPEGSIDEQEVRNVVSRAVPGIRSEDVVVSIAQQPTIKAPVSGPGAEESHKLVPFLGWWEVPEDEYSGLAAIVVSLLLLVAGLSGLAGYIYGQYSLARSTDEPSSFGSLNAGSGAALERLEAPTDEAGE
jgi:type III secretory pathway lipoprotein EscJ